MTEKNELSELLKQFRETVGEPQKEVAQALDIPPSSLSFYESGERTPPYSTLIKLLDYYGGRLAIESDFGKWIFSHQNDGITLEKLPEKEELDLLAGLDSDEREDLIAYIRRRKHRR